MSNLLEMYVKNNAVSSPAPAVNTVQVQPQTAPVPAVDTTQIRDEFVKKTRKQGRIEKFYNFLKNKTNFGLSSNKVNSAIESFAQGGTTKEDLDKTISGWEASQENAAQIIGDTASGLAGMAAFFGIKNFAKHAEARFTLNCLPDFAKDFPGIGETMDGLKKSASSKVKVALFGALAAMQVSCLVKQLALWVNGIGSKKYKLDKSETAGMSKEEIKIKKQVLKSERKGQSLKNGLTGLLNGALAPVIALGGGIAGVPLYLGITTGVRYLANKHNEDKSVNDFAQSLKDNAAMNIIGAAAVAVPAFKKARFSSVLSKNMDEVVSKLKDVKLKAPELPSSQTAYSELEEMLLNSDSVAGITNSRMNLDDQIRALTHENIFAVKFKQIQNEDELSKMLKEDCPASRTMENAQKVINGLLGSAKYTVSKCLGVGTIAETYLAKDASGKEVCIKILKDGINAEKIARDKEKFAALIKNGVPDDALNDSQKYLLKNLDNLAEGIAKETDFVNEMNAAKKLKNFTKLADVVVPVDAKDGIYIMEKAPGISLETLSRYYELESRKKFYEKIGYGDYSANMVEEFEKEMAKLKAKAPDFDNFDLNNDEIKRILDNYIDVFNEQFNKINKNGKTLHADIHPGNIFVNLNALKNKNGKIFTLIDTGNTVDISKEQAIRSLKLTSYIGNGNIKDITDYVLDGAVLPANMTKEQAAENVAGELKTIFFDTKTSLDAMNNESLLALSGNIMRKYGIIPNDSQLNLNKAKKSANNSLDQLQETFFNKKFSKIDTDNMSLGKSFTTGASVMTMFNHIKHKKKSAVQLQQMKNMLQMSPSEIVKQKFNRNMNKTNSQDYLTYKLKQNLTSGFDIDVLEEKIKDMFLGTI